MRTLSDDGNADIVQNSIVDLEHIVFGVDNHMKKLYDMNAQFQRIPLINYWDIRQGPKFMIVACVCAKFVVSNIQKVLFFPDRCGTADDLNRNMGFPEYLYFNK